MTRRIRFTHGARALLALALFLVLGYACFATYLLNIPFTSGSQPDYLIDAYYYLYLGEQALQVVAGSAQDIVQAVADLQPNQSSFGIVLLNAAVLWAGQAIELVPLLMSLLLFGTAWSLYVRGHCNGTILLLPFSGLFPYLFLPSKELFIIVALLGALACLLNRGWSRLGALPFMVLMYLARPEAAALFLFSLVVWLALQWRPALLALAVVALVGYAAVGREAAYAVSTIFQLQSDQAESAFCNVGPLSVCVGDIGGLEQVYFQRLLTLVLLPLKWVTDVLMIPAVPNLLVTEVISRLFVGLQVGYAVIAWNRRSSVTGPVRHARGILCTFAAIYAITYGCVLYFQPTRQLILASTVVCIAMSLQKRSGSTSVSPVALASA